MATTPPPAEAEDGACSATRLGQDCVSSRGRRTPVMILRDRSSLVLWAIAALYLAMMSAGLWSLATDWWPRSRSEPAELASLAMVALIILSGGVTLGAQALRDDGLVRIEILPCGALRVVVTRLGGRREEALCPADLAEVGVRQQRWSATNSFEDRVYTIAWLLLHDGRSYIIAEGTDAEAVHARAGSVRAALGRPG